MRGRRRALVWTLIVLASLIALGSILTTWVHRQMLDNQSWKDASARLIENPEVQNGLSVFLVNELYDNVDVASGLEQRLPADLKPLASPVAAALRQPATDGVKRLLEAPRVQQLWINANAVAQQKLVNVLENKTGHGISTGNGVVTLDLSQLVTEIGTELGVPASALAKIPPDTGVITVMRSDQLSAAQTAVQGVRVLSTGLLVLVLALYALAIYLARGERRQTLRNIGFAFVLVGLTVLVVRRVAGNVAVDALTSPQGERRGAPGVADRQRDPQPDRLGDDPLRRDRRRRRDLRRSDRGRDQRSRAGRAGAQRAPGHRLGRRRRRLPPARPVGRHARAAHVVGHRAARRADRHRRRRAASPDAARVPRRGGRCRRRGDVAPA